MYATCCTSKHVLFCNIKKVISKLDPNISLEDFYVIKKTPKMDEILLACEINVSENELAEAT